MTDSDPIALVSTRAYCNPMTGFTKLFSSIIHSTVWREELHVKVVWVTMLAMADRNGYVPASLPGLADASRVTVEQCVEAIRLLSSPDEYSRTKEHEGRRIETVEGGWRLLNHAKYRELRSDDERRIQTREAVKRYREKKADVLTVSHGKPDVSDVSHGKPKQKQKQKQKQELTTTGVFNAAWEEYPKRAGGNSRREALKAWQSRVAAGVIPEVMLEGVRRYAAFVRATGKEGTEYVKQASTFFGPSEHYAEAWEVGANGQRADNAPRPLRATEMILT